MILDIFFLLLHPLTTSSLKLKFFIMTFFMPSLELIPCRLTVRMESLLLFSKTVLPSSLLLWSNSFVCVSILLPILLAGSLLTLNLSLKRVNPPILQSFLTESWSSFFRDFGKTFAVGLDVSKAFNRVWHKSSILLSVPSSPVSFLTVLLLL